MTDKSTHFGKCLKHIRTSENLTLQSFAKKLGISKSYISEVERGEKEPGYKLIKSLKRTYPELNLNYLIGEENASQGIERLDILEKRVNRLFDIVQEYPTKYGFQDIVLVPLAGMENMEHIKLPSTLVKYNNSLAFCCANSFRPQIDAGDIVVISPEIKLQDQSIALFLGENRQFFVNASLKNKKTILTDNTGREILLQGPENKILGVVYLVIKTLN